MNNYDEDNIFAKIISDKIPAVRVYEDDDTIVIMDAFPEKPGHMLAIPKDKSRNIYDIADQQLEKLSIVVKKISEVQKLAFGSSGVKIIQNCEAAAGQVVFHSHIHIIPYFSENSDMPKYLDTKEKQAEAMKVKLM
tara:strand:+ start:483 stop:890 length:408 start_codon:yes stop_codon:yes gene_type:complete